MENFFQSVFRLPFRSRGKEAPLPPEPVTPDQDRGALTKLEQAVFAEAFRQGLFAGLPSQEAFLLAISIHPHPRFSQSEAEVKALLSQGCDLDQSLVQTGSWVSEELLATLEIGERRGCLQGLLEVVAMGLTSNPGKELVSALGRLEATTRFCAALSTLLKGTHFKNEMIAEAGRIAGGGLAFRQAVQILKEKVEIGSSLSHGMSLSGQVFDRFLCRLLKKQEDPSKVQPILAMLGNPS